MQISLRDVLIGHIMRQSLMVFEGALNDFTKTKMRSHFKDDDPNDPDVKAFNATLTHAKGLREEKRERVTKRILFLDDNIATQTDGDKKFKWNSERKKKGIELVGLDEMDAVDAGRTAKGELAPRWVREARKSVGMGTKSYVKTNDPWDAFTLVSVLRWFLSDVFEETFDDVFDTKEFLSSILHVVNARNIRAHVSNFFESDVLHAISQMKTVLEQCGLTDAVKNVGDILSHAQQLIQQSSSNQTLYLRKEDYNNQILYQALNEYALHLETSVGTYKFQDKTVCFHKGYNQAYTEVVKEQKKQFRKYTSLRNWYFHHAPTQPDVTECLKAMETTMAAFKHTTWCIPPFWTPASDTIGIASCSPSTRVPMTMGQEEVVVGRADVIADIKQKLIDESAPTRVLVHGLPGMGKDTVAKAVINHSVLGGLQAWLQASTDELFRRQLVNLFTTHRRWVVAGIENDQQNCIAKIFEFLVKDSSEWLFVIADLHSASNTAIDLVKIKSHGRVLITSQGELVAPLENIGNVFRFFLPPLTTDDSVQLLLNMNLFSKKVSKVEEDEELLKSIVEIAGLAYTAPPTTENLNDKKERQFAMRIELHARNELNQPTFLKFLRSTCGNIPLQVSRYGHILRADKRIKSTVELVEQVEEFSQTKVDEVGRDAKEETHHLGLVRSAKFMLSRFMSDTDYTDKQRQNAIALLISVSLLDRKDTPMSLFSDHNVIKLLEDIKEADIELRSLPKLQPLPDSSKAPTNSLIVFEKQNLLLEARKILHDAGFLHSTGHIGQVGVMHQSIQQFLCDFAFDDFHHVIVKKAVQRMLLTRFPEDFSSPQVAKDLIPCVEAWCNAIVDTAGPKDLILLQRLGCCVSELQGDANRALILHEKANTVAKSSLPPGHSCITSSLWSLANTNLTLGNHNTALALHERALRESLNLTNPEKAALLSYQAKAYSETGQTDLALVVQKKVVRLNQQLPLDHVNVTIAKGNLANTYREKGLFNHALSLHRDTLEYLRRELSGDHPYIASAINNLAATCSDLGMLSEALELGLEALELQKNILGEKHRDVATSMLYVAKHHSDLGHYAESLAYANSAYTLRQEILPQNHPDLAWSMSSLAEVHTLLGDHERALALNLQAWDFKKRVLLPDDPQIAKSLLDLSESYSALGDYDHALRFCEESLAFRKRVLGGDHPNVAEAMWFLAKICADTNRLIDALQLHQQALDLRQRAYKEHPEHPVIATSMISCGVTLSRLKKHDEALTWKLKGLHLRQKILPAKHPEIAAALSNVAVSYGALKKPGKAYTFVKSALNTLKAALPPHHYRIVVAQSYLVNACTLLGKHREAFDLVVAASESRKDLPANHTDRLSSTAQLEEVSTRYAACVSQWPNIEERIQTLTLIFNAERKYLPAGNTCINKTLAILVHAQVTSDNC